MKGWQKFAIQQSTYMRALENKNVANGRPAGMFTAPPGGGLAKLKPGASDFARAPGPLTPTPQQQDMQGMLAKTPWAGPEHGGTAHAEATFNAQLKRRGLDVQTPRGDTGAQIERSFGRAGGDGTKVMGAKTRVESQGPGPLDHLDRRRRTPNPLGLPDAEGAHGAMPIQRGPARAQDQATHALVRDMQNAHPSYPDRRAAPRSTTPGGAGTAVLGRPHPPQATANLSMPKTGADQFKLAGGRGLGIGLGVGLPLALGGAMLLNKPGIKADIHNMRHQQGTLEQKDHAQEIPEAVQNQASQVTQALAARGINPTGLRIAVDAPSGAGKTVLSKAIAGQLGLRHHGLDWRPHMRRHQLMGGGDIEKTPYAPHAGEILEHQQLLRSYDPELFDVAIHIHKDPNAIKQQILGRGRGARTVDLMDYDKSIGVGRKAFETLGGEAIDLGGGAMMKVRPQEGWGNALDQQLTQMGIDPSNLSRHEKLLSLHAGKRSTGKGWTPYVRNPFTGGEMAAMAASVPLGVLAARALRRR